MTIKNQLIEFAQTNPAEEVCALIYSKAGQEGFVPCKNTNSDKKHHFTIRPEDYKKAYQLGNITAVFHSHVNDNPEFSPLDYQQATGHNLGYWLYDLKTQTFKELDPKQHKFSFYLRKEFQEGVQDCFSLVRNFYSKELKIEIPDRFTDRQKGFTAIQQDILNKKEYLKLAAEFGFSLVKWIDLKTFDIMIFNFNNRLHMGIYLQPECILHQLRTKKSCIEKMTPEYQGNFLAAFRKG